MILLSFPFLLNPACFPVNVSVWVEIREVGKERGKENFSLTSTIVRCLHTFWVEHVFKVDSVWGGSLQTSISQWSFLCHFSDLGKCMLFLLILLYALGNGRSTSASFPLRSYCSSNVPRGKDLRCLYYFSHNKSEFLLLVSKSEWSSIDPSCQALSPESFTVAMEA